MRIYNLLKAPEGLSYDDIDYEAVYQSGYTAGYDSGYTDGSDFCGEFSITPSSLVYPISGGSKDIEIIVPSSWYIDDTDFEWEYLDTPYYSKDTGWTGYSASVLNQIEISSEAGTGDKVVTVSLPDLSDVPPVFVASYEPGYPGGYAAAIAERTGKLNAYAGDFKKEITVSQNIDNTNARSFNSTGGTYRIMLDTAAPDFEKWEINLNYDFENDPYGTNNPWTSYTFNYSGLVTELPIVLDLPIPFYTSGLTNYWYGANGEINVYYGLQFIPKDWVPTPGESYIDYGRLYVTILPPEKPRLNISNTFPAAEQREGEFYPSIHIPSTGGVYTMTVSGNSDWTGNTVAFGPGTLCTLSPNSGAANESTSVTVTFPTNDGLQGLIELGVSPMPDTGYTQDVNYFTYQFTFESGGTTEKYVADLVDEGYANFVQSGGTYKGGNYVEILSSCPYDMSEIVDLEDVALNQKQLSGMQNTIVWNQVLPSGWNVEDIAAIYDGQSLNYTPRGEQFWAITSAVSSFTITYTGDTYVTSDYPWGSYGSEGVFAPRWNQNKQAQYIANGWISTPETVTVNFASTFSSVSQVMFSQMKGTRTLTINQLAGTFSCHDVTGMFEGNTNMETLNINGNFNWSTWRTCHNVFDGCDALTGIPYCSSWSREHANNELYPHADGQRGSANCRHIFNTPALEYLGPVFNMGAISLCGCTYDGRSQGALSDTLFNCPVLEDVLIKNLNNNDWNFTDNSTLTYIPSMNVASIEYLLNNVEDVTADPHTVTLSTLHQGQISQAAIDNATSKGWTIAYA